jgi:protein ImuB
MCSYMVVCVHLPRFELVVAAGGPQALAGRALAIAPVVGGAQRVGEVSGAAEAFGVAPGMALGEALARCPELGLIAADPLGVAQAWEQIARALEGIGAAVELERAGLAYFETDPLRGMYGGERETIAAAREAARSPSGRVARVGAGPTRFCALAAALAARSRRVVVVDEREAGRYLAAQPVSLLGYHAETAAMVGGLSRLGVRTLGELTALGRDAMADRFGAAGVLAHRLAAGEEEPLRTRRANDTLEEEMELWEASSGAALERVLGVLVERLLARGERRGRTLGAVTLSAVLVDGGGTWSERVVFRQAIADAKRICMALSLRLALLPAPAQAMRLAVERFGPPGGVQRALLGEEDAARRERLHEAVRQMRALAGRDAALRALCVDLESRVPERRVVLSPFTG